MIRMDVNDDVSVQQGIDEILEREGRLDVVVNNAGFGLACSVEDTSIEEAKAQFETNFFGVLRVCRAVLPTMRAQRSGLIVNVSSVAGLIGQPFQGFYCASKFALEGMTEALSIEVRPFGIRVVLIEPGDFSTSFTANRRHVEPNAAYLKNMTNALDVSQADEMKGSHPDQLAALLERVIKSRHPRLRYVVGPFYEKVAVGLKKTLPPRLFEWALSKYYKQGSD